MAGQRYSCLRWFYVSNEETPSWFYDNPVLNVVLDFIGPTPNIVGVLGVLLAGAILGISAVAATTTPAHRSGLPALILGAVVAVAMAFLSATFAMAQQAFSVAASTPESAPAAHSILPTVGSDVTVPVAWILLAGLAMWLLALPSEIRYCSATRRGEARRNSRADEASTNE